MDSAERAACDGRDIGRGGPLGTPFFVMDQVDGRVPLDNPPYVFTGWLLEATPEERAALQRSSIALLA
ncbi:MAG: hypothetical protein WBR11_06960, partial [Terriglobales bacterium]